MSFVSPRLLLVVANTIIDRALRKVDEIMADLCICDIAKEKSEQMSAVMEKCFKRFLAKRRCETDKPNEILKFVELDIMDEFIQKCKFTDLELKKTRTFIEAAYDRFVDMYLKAQKVSKSFAFNFYLVELYLIRFLYSKLLHSLSKVLATICNFQIDFTLFTRCSADDFQSLRSIENVLR